MLSQLFPWTQQSCAEGQSARLPQRIVDLQVSGHDTPGPTQEKLFTYMLFTTVGTTQHWPPPFATGQLTFPQGTTAATQLFPPRQWYPAAQPAVLRSVQDVAHAVAEAHANIPGHGDAPADDKHVPLPLQRPCVSDAPEQLGLPQNVPAPCIRQAPTPSHMPSLPQEFVESTPHSESGSVPATIGRHRPLLAPVFAVTHARHVPPQALSQQTPSTQMPETHD